MLIFQSSFKVATVTAGITTASKAWKIARRYSPAYTMPPRKLALCPIPAAIISTVAATKYSFFCFSGTLKNPTKTPSTTRIDISHSDTCWLITAMGVMIPKTRANSMDPIKAYCPIRLSM